MYDEVAILIPCHSLEDFPTYHEGEDAQSVLANWTAMWHPALIASAAKMPKWYRVEDPPEQLDRLLLLIPTISKAELPAGFARRAQEAGGTVLRGVIDREEILAQALEKLGEIAPLAVELAPDFLALGYCYLQVELLTRQMRYSSSLDEIYFNQKTVEAAQAAVAGDRENATEALQACFDVLMEERNQFYAVDSYFLDFTLLAETVLGEWLHRELQETTPTNLWLTGQLAEKLAADHPETAALVREKLAGGKLGLVGGEYSETPLALLEPESILLDFHRGHASYEASLGIAPKVFGRRRFGLSPFLPQVLKSLGFQGAIHANLDEGRVQVPSHGRVKWEGVDGSTIDALTKAPLDANKPESFLSLFNKLGEAMDSEHVATITFAHWPGHVSPWYEDLKRIAKYANCLGSFLTVDAYFETTDLPSFHDHFKPHDYRSPYFKQSIIKRQPGPVSTHVLRQRHNAEASQIGRFRALQQLLSGQVELAEPPAATLVEPGSPELDQLPQSLADQVSAAAARLAEAMPRSTQAASDGYLLLNPASFGSVQGVWLDKLDYPPLAEKPVLAQGEVKPRKFAVVEVPPCGYVHLTGNAKATSSGKTLVDGNKLRNEFMEVHIHPESGAIQSIYDYKSRGNRFSQQLGLRMPGQAAGGTRYRDPDESAQYTKMVAQSVKTLIDTTALGEIQTAGQLIDADGGVAADFTQVYRLWRNNRVLEIEIELRPRTEPRTLPWNSHYACRFAWPDEAALLHSDRQWVRERAVARKIEAPNYVEVESGSLKTTILTGGIPFHLRNNRRMLDTILIPTGETEHKFRLGIGIDLPYPLQAAQSFAHGVVPHFETASPPQPGNTSWLLHLSARNVALTHLAPTIGEAGKVTGLEARVLETENRHAEAALRTFRPVKEAWLTDFRGKKISDLKVEGDKIQFQLAPGQWQQIQAIW